MNTPCRLRHHSPRLNATGWTCPDCVADTKASPLAAAHAAIEQPSEWVIFTRALVVAARDDRTVHQSDVRPLIRGRIEPKHIGTYWRRAKAERLVRDTGDVERSDDQQGRNSHRLEPIYELIGAAA